MTNHTTRKAQNTKHGSSETPIGEILNESPPVGRPPAEDEFDSFNSFQSKITEAVMSGRKDHDGLPTAYTDERMVRYYLKKPQDWEEFKRTGYFILNNVKVKIKGSDPEDEAASKAPPAVAHHPV